MVETAEILTSWIMQERSLNQSSSGSVEMNALFQFTNNDLPFKIYRSVSLHEYKSNIFFLAQIFMIWELVIGIFHSTSCGGITSAAMPVNMLMF